MLKQAVVLAGGKGTRLGDLTRTVPKPLIDVAGKPFVEYVIEEVARHGVDEVLLLAGYLGEQFVERYDGVRIRGAVIRVLREESPLGTGGAVRLALPRLHDEFLLANGDTFFDCNLLALPSPAPGGLTMALRATAPGARYGTVEFIGDRVRAFRPPAGGRTGPINAGIYRVSRALVETFPEGASSIEADHFPRLAAAGAILGRVFDGWFIDMGVPDDLAVARAEMLARTRRPAVFFDRDGVLNADEGYTHRPDQFRWLPGAREAIRLCNDRGWFAFVVTNQAGVARGLYDEQQVQSLHAFVQEELAAAGAHVDAFEYCPHHPDGAVEGYRRDCRRRKPGPGMIEALLESWPVDAARSFLVGDKDSDVAAATAAGIRGHLFPGGDLAAFVASRLG